MTDTLVLVWSGTSFTSSSISSTNSSYHLTGTNMTVDWGDGTTGTITSGQRFTHTYSYSGTYTIIITGDSITKLGTYCFRGCTGLKKIIIPPSVHTLNGYSLTGCNQLNNIIFMRSTPPTMISTNCYDKVPTTCKIYVPNSSYKSASHYPSSSTYTYIEQDTTEMAKAAIIVKEMCNKKYPVGSIYMSYGSTNPSELFGGAWTQIQDKFLLASGSTYANGSTGGSADAIVPSHTHSFTEGGGSLNVGTTRGVITSGFQGGGTSWQNKNKNVSSISSSGVDGTGKNMPPYIAVYIWERIG